VDAVLGALALVLNPEVALVIVLSAIYGTFVGAIPGLTATMSVALLVPLTFFMDPVPAIAAIVSTTATAIFAGDIPGALLRIPGTPASAAYVEEAFKMTRKGEGEQALGASLIMAAIGGIIGTVILMGVAPGLARFAINFSSFEYFWLACLGLTCAVLISTGTVLKGAVSLLLGLFIATIGIDIAVGYPRFTFGSIELLGGVSFIPAMIGMFALSEILRKVVVGDGSSGVEKRRVGNVFKGLPGLLRRYKVNVARSSVLGTVIGALPGAGADIAAWIAFTLSKRFSSTPEKFGTGYVEGIVDGGSANNAAVAGAWTPALVFGIPGDTVTAIAIGVLYLKGLNPGPLIFTRNPDLVYAVFIAFLCANIVLVPIGLMAIKLSCHLLRIPANRLMPIILMFCIVGVFAINNTVFAVWIMAVLGILAFLMEENGFPIAPAILGIVLGRMVEDNFMVSIMKTGGGLIGFFERPIAAVLGVTTLAIWLYLIVRAVLDVRAPRRDRERSGILGGKH
jgi:TctA family transporter